MGSDTETVHSILSFCHPWSTDTFALTCKEPLLFNVFRALGGTTTALGPSMIALLQRLPIELLENAVRLMGPLSVLSFPQCAPNTALLATVQ